MLLPWRWRERDLLSCPLFTLQEQQESVRAVPEKSAAPLLDVFSSMLKDTTGQHRAHLFDLNCKICTGEPSRHGPLERRVPFLLLKSLILLIVIILSEVYGISLLSL